LSATSQNFFVGWGHIARIIYNMLVKNLDLKLALNRFKLLANIPELVSL